MSDAVESGVDHIGVDRVRKAAVIAYHSSPLVEPGSGDAGGMTVYVRELADALSRLGMVTDIYTRASYDVPRVVEMHPGVRVVSIEAGPAAALEKDDIAAFREYFVAGIRAFAMTQRLSYDLIHSHYWQSGLVARELVRMWGIPHVHSHHTLGRVKNRFLAPGDVPEPQARLDGEADVIGTADVLIASTDEEMSQLACLYEASHDRLKILHPGVDHDRFLPGDRVSARGELGLSDEAVLLAVGRIQRLKGLDLAIRATEQLVHALERKVRLLIVGGPSGRWGVEELARLRALCASRDLEDNVSFLGPQPHARLPEFYRAADALLACSHSESFGLAALEAQACGTPVVGTAVGGLSHIVRDGRSGWLVDERDATEIAARLKTLLMDRDLSGSFSRAAIESAAEFSWERTAAGFLELYECLVREEFPELCTC